MFAGYNMFALLAPFGENIAKNCALEFTRFECNLPKEERKKYSQTQAQKDSEQEMHFEHSDDSNQGMSTMERLVFSTQQIQVENQNLMIQRMQCKDVQDWMLC